MLGEPHSTSAGGGAVGVPVNPDTGTVASAKGTILLQKELFACKEFHTRDEKKLT